MMTPRKKKPGPGRPSQGRSEHLEVRLTPDEKEAFSTVASSTGLSLSDWVRQTLRQVSASRYEDIGDTPPFSQKGKKR